MPRPPRIYLEKALYYVTCKGDHRQPIFNDQEDYRVFMDTLKKYKEQVIEEAKELANLPFDIFEKKLLPGFNLFLFIFYLVGYILALILIFIPFLAYKSGFLSWYMTIIITGIYTFPLFAYSLKIYNREEWHLIRFIKYRKEKRESMKC